MILRLKYNGAQVTHRSYGFGCAFGYNGVVGERSTSLEAIPEGVVERVEVRMLARVA